MASDELTAKTAQDARAVAGQFFRYTAEVHHLASKVQRIARAHYQRRVGAVVDIQKVFRSYMVQHEAKVKKWRLAAAQTVIARWYRRHLAKMEWARIMIQSLGRGWLGRRAAVQWAKELRALTKIQSQMRARLAVHVVQRRRDLYWNAVTVQQVGGVNGWPGKIATYSLTTAVVTIHFILPPRRPTTPHDSRALPSPPQRPLLI